MRTTARDTAAHNRCAIRDGIHPDNASSDSDRHNVPDGSSGGSADRYLRKPDSDRGGTGHDDRSDGGNDPNSTVSASKHM